MKTLRLFLVAAVLLMLFSCSKKAPHIDVDVKPDTPANAHHDVYAVGNSLVTGKYPVATLWKNDVIKRLTDGSDYADATSVFVANKNVYVAGTDKGIATLWTNGVPTSLTDTPTVEHPKVAVQANAVWVIGTDVYVCGDDNNGGNFFAILWKNGIRTVLTPPNRSGHASSMFVSGHDIYVAGNIFSDDGTHTLATIWKNGIAMSLTTDDIDGSALCVGVSGNDIFVYGAIWDPGQLAHSVLWKNGVIVPFNGDIKAMRGFGNDLYFVGFQADAARALRPTVWKNGVPTVEPEACEFINSIFVSGKDIYLNGVATSGAAEIWKNGVPSIVIPGYRPTVNSIFVK